MIGRWNGGVNVLTLQKCNIALKFIVPALGFG
jgi:hypothetical protein